MASSTSSIFSARRGERRGAEPEEAGGDLRVEQLRRRAAARSGEDREVLVAGVGDHAARPRRGSRRAAPGRPRAGRRARRRRAMRSAPARDAGSRCARRGTRCRARSAARRPGCGRARPGRPEHRSRGVPPRKLASRAGPPAALPVRRAGRVVSRALSRARPARPRVARTTARPGPGLRRGDARSRRCNPTCAGRRRRRRRGSVRRRRPRTGRTRGNHRR